MSKAISEKAYSEHYKKYAELCVKHHVKWNVESPKSVGETLETLTVKLAEDEHLNNVPLRRWDILAASFFVYNSRSGLSLAEVVCMQKHAATDLVRRSQVKYALPTFASNGCEKGSDK